MQVKSSQKSHKPKSQKTRKHAKNQMLTSTPKSTNAPKTISTRKPPKTKQKNHAQKSTKNPQTQKIQIPPKSQTPCPLSQIFANPLFVAYQHLSHKIPCFPNHTPCQSSSLLAVCFDLHLYQRHT